MSVTLSRAVVGRPVISDLYRKEGVVSRVSPASNSIWVTFPDEPEEQAFDPAKLTWVETIDDEFVAAVRDSEPYTDEGVPCGDYYLRFEGYPQSDEDGGISNAGLGYQTRYDRGIFTVSYDTNRIFPLIREDVLPSPWFVLELEERIGFTKP